MGKKKQVKKAKTTSSHLIRDIRIGIHELKSQAKIQEKINPKSTSKQVRIDKEC